MPIKKNSRIAEEINKDFINVGQNLAERMQKTFKIFEDFLFTVQKNIEYRNLTFEELEKLFKSVKINKAAGHDDIDSNIINKVYDEISYPLSMICHSSFYGGMFPKLQKFLQF